MNLTSRFRGQYKWCAVLMVGGFLFACMSTAVFADTPLITGNVTLGGLTETAAAGYNFTGAIGTTATFPMPFTVSDLRGSGLGWHITLSTSQFTNPNHTAFPFPVTAATMTALPNATCVTAGTCSADPITSGTITLPLALTSGVGVLQGTPATIFSAPAAGGSSGIYTVTPTISVAIPGNAFVTTGGTDVYTSTFTLAAVSGP